MEEVGRERDWWRETGGGREEGDRGNGGKSWGGKGGC